MITADACRSRGGRDCSALYSTQMKHSTPVMCGEISEKQLSLFLAGTGWGSR